MHRVVNNNCLTGRKEAEDLASAIADALSRPEPLPEAELPTRNALRLQAAGEGEGGGGTGVVIVELEADEAEKNSAVQVRFFI